MTAMMRREKSYIKWCINICDVRGASIYGYEEKEPRILHTHTHERERAHEHMRALEECDAMRAATHRLRRGQTILFRHMLAHTCAQSKYAHGQFIIEEVCM